MFSVFSLKNGFSGVKNSILIKEVKFFEKRLDKNNSVI